MRRTSHMPQLRARFESAYPRSTARMMPALLGVLLAVGCSQSDGSGSGTVSIRIEPEDVIVSGLSAGEGQAQIRDGWNVSFEKYVVVVGEVALHHVSSASERVVDQLIAVDLSKLSPRGVELWSVADLAEGRWDFEYASEAGAPASGIEVSDDDLQKLKDQGLTHMIEGTLTSPDGLSCPPTDLAQVPSDAVAAGKNSFGAQCYQSGRIAFSIAAEASTLYGPCEIDELPGLAVVANSTTTVAISIHGDHLFFNGFPAGSETEVRRLAQWMADCDLNLDGLVTNDELRQVSPSDVLDPEVYQLGGASIAPLDTMETYVRAQLKTQGHYQGEGECPIDGVAHEH